MQIRDRIKELRRVRAGDLKPHPKNWRVHMVDLGTYDTKVFCRRFFWLRLRR